VVTGAGRGIGRVIAMGLAADGFDVCVGDLDADGADATAKAIRATGAGAMSARLDVRDPGSVAEVFEGVERTLGVASVLVNNAGVTVQKAAADMTLDEWNFVQSVCLTGTFLCAREAASRLIAAGVSGAIVNIASINGMVAPAFHPSPAYAAAKAGVIGLTRALAVEWGRARIRVNAVSPTYVRTEMTAARLADSGYASRILERTPLGRIAEPEDMVGAVRFLASESALMITGQTLAVDGGWTIV